MKNAEEIMEAYEKADWSSRLNYYMEYPSLRPEFMELERKNGHPTTENRIKRVLKKWLCRSTGSMETK